jgi:transcriptional regulator with XRE-family HTH domain
MKPDELKRWRARHQITQDELAKLLSVNIMTVSRWERGLQTAPAFLRLALESLARKRHDMVKAEA